MAKLDIQTFTPTPATPPVTAVDMEHLLGRMKKILKDLTGSVMTPSGDFLNPPRGLNARRDMLRMDYPVVWQNTKIVYDGPTSGATATHSTNTITFGEFFTRRELPEMHLKKVLLHEFLHLVVTVPREFHHGQINQIIQFNLRLPGEPNPLGTD